MLNISRRVFSAWKLFRPAGLLLLCLWLAGGHLAEAQPQAVGADDDEPDNIYSFAWPPQPWLRQIFYMAIPEPMSDQELEQLKIKAERHLANPQATEKQKRRADILLALSVNDLAGASARVADLRARYPDDPEYLWVDGALKLMDGRPEEARACFSELSSLVAGRRNWQVFAKQSEAWALLSANRFEDAFETARNQVAKLQAGAALKSHQGWFTYYIYGQVWAHKGFNETALKCYRLARIRWLKGPESQANTPVGRYLDLQAGDGNMLARQYRNAQKLYLNLTLDRRAVFGRKHPLSLEAQHRLILAFFAIGETDKALELGDEFVTMAPDVFGPESDQMLDVMTVIAKVAMLRDEWTKAENLLNRVLHVLTARPGDSAHLPLANTYVQMGGLYLVTDRPAEAEDYFRRGYDLACGTFSNEAQMAGACLTASYQVAFSLAKLGQKEPAREMLSRAKRMAEQNKVATVHSEQYAAIASLLAELDKETPRLADFKNLTIR